MKSDQFDTLRLRVQDYLVANVQGHVKTEYHQTVFENFVFQISLYGPAYSVSGVRVQGDVRKYASGQGQWRKPFFVIRTIEELEAKLVKMLPKLQERLAAIDRAEGRFKERMNEELALFERLKQALAQNKVEHTVVVNSIDVKTKFGVASLYCRGDQLEVSFHSTVKQLDDALDFVKRLGENASTPQDQK